MNSAAVGMFVGTVAVLEDHNIQAKLSKWSNYFQPAPQRLFCIISRYRLIAGSDEINTADSTSLGSGLCVTNLLRGFSLD